MEGSAAVAAQQHEVPAVEVSGGAAHQSHIWLVKIKPVGKREGAEMLLRDNYIVKCAHWREEEDKNQETPGCNLEGRELPLGSDLEHLHFHC
jgi:hypothetical protein